MTPYEKGYRAYMNGAEQFPTDISNEDYPQWNEGWLDAMSNECNQSCFAFCEHLVGSFL